MLRTIPFASTLLMAALAFTLGMFALASTWRLDSGHRSDRGHGHQKLRAHVKGQLDAARALYRNAAR